MYMKRDLEKRPRKETSKRDLEETYKREGLIQAVTESNYSQSLRVKI